MDSSNVQVAVVGAGLAGMAASYRLHQAGVDVAVYEANPERVGGRCWTERDYFENGQYCEHGAERIDTRQREIQDLAAELGLELHDHLADAGPGAGALVSGADDDPAVAAGIEFCDALVADMARRGISVGGPPQDHEPSKAEIALDAISVRDWFEENIEGGASSPTAVEFLTEISLLNGREADQLSAEHLVSEFDTLTGYFMSDDDREDERIADVRYQVEGGNDQIPNGMRARMPEGSVTLGARLSKVTRTSDGGYDLEFGSGASVGARAIVLALPFTTLREVDLSGSGFSAEKLAAIEEYDIGILSKIIMQFNRPRSDFTGLEEAVIRNDPRLIALCTNEAEASMLVTAFYAAGDALGLSGGVAHAPASEAVVGPVLDALEPHVPGLKGAFTGLAWLDSWGDSEYSHGAYSSFQPGQATRFGRVAGAAEEGAFFAGEHTSIRHRSTMNGAVESGQRAAREALDHLG